MSKKCNLCIFVNKNNTRTMMMTIMMLMAVIMMMMMINEKDNPHNIVRS